MTNINTFNKRVNLTRHNYIQVKFELNLFKLLLVLNTTQIRPMITNCHHQKKLSKLKSHPQSTPVVIKEVARLTLTKILTKWSYQYWNPYPNYPNNTEMLLSTSTKISTEINLRGTLHLFFAIKLGWVSNWSKVRSIHNPMTCPNFTSRWSFTKIHSYFTFQHLFSWE